MSQKTASKTRSPNTSSATKPKAATPEINPVNSWEFKVTGRGTSGWMSWVKEGSSWIPLRASETSFVSAVAALEPEIMRLAFPHKVTARKAAPAARIK
jgi:hypothetical protein